jgi:hypothetical protein
MSKILGVRYPFRREPLDSRQCGDKRRLIMPFELEDKKLGLPDAIATASNWCVEILDGSLVCRVVTVHM